LCLSSSSALLFSNYSFWVHHLVHQDDQQLLAYAMASDFYDFSKRTIGVSLQIKLHALIRLGVYPGKLSYLGYETSLLVVEM
jgi:hypothetical protein